METTKILFQRHEDHDKTEGLEVLLTDAEQRAVARGKALAERGTKIDVIVSSPRPRALRTALATAVGNGTTPNCFTDRRLGDFKADPRTPLDGMKKLKAMAIERYGDESDSSLARAMLELPELHDFLLLRAEEGAKALRDIATQHSGETVLVTSHGVARMEIVLRWLNGKRGLDVLDITNGLIERGEIVELILPVEGDYL